MTYSLDIDAECTILGYSWMFLPIQRHWAEWDAFNETIASLLGPKKCIPL